MTIRLAACCLVLAACGRSRSTPERSVASGSAPPPLATGAPPTEAGAVTCAPEKFAETTPLPEASGAGWMTIDGALALVAISDSGNDGAYAVIDPDTGATREQGKLPLGASPGEDLEGAGVRGNKLYALTSPGWMRSWTRVERGFAIADEAYPIGPVDLPGKKGGMGDTPPAGTGMVCPSEFTNCGRNYEALCLAPDSVSDGCIGFAGSKADGALYCLVATSGKIVLDRTRTIPVMKPGQLADCAFASDGRLYVGANAFGFGAVSEVQGWREPGKATLRPIGPMLVGFPETLAVRGDEFYRLSDTGSAPSGMLKLRCTP